MKPSRLAIFLSHSLTFFTLACRFLFYRMPNDCKGIFFHMYVDSVVVVRKTTRRAYDAST